MAGKRLIHKNICISEKINKLSQGAEILYYRIMTNIDDYGHCTGNAYTLKDDCFPIKEEMTPGQIEKDLTELFISKLLKSYHVHNVRYIEVDRFEDFQVFRSDRGRRKDCPMPKEYDKPSAYHMDTTGIPVVRPKVKVKVEEEVKVEAEGQTPPTAALSTTKTLTPQQQFVESWGLLYKAGTGNEYKADKEDFIIAATLIGKFKLPNVIEKAKLLFLFCKEGDRWFAKGMTDFTIKNLSNKWNNIVGEKKKSMTDKVTEDVNRIADKIRQKQEIANASK